MITNRGLRGLTLTAMGAIALGGCGNKAFDDSFKKGWHDKFVESCSTAAKASMPAGAAAGTMTAVNSVCSCTADKMTASAKSTSELIAMGNDQAKAMAFGKECMAQVNPAAAQRMGG